MQRQIAFQMGMGMGGMSFTIDGRRFDPQRDDQSVTFGAIEEWTVINTSPLAHPFHLHVWPFTVLVYHCHILDHEDAGMMATVNVRR